MKHLYFTPNDLANRGNNNPIIKAQIQLTMVARATPFSGRISALQIQTIGPSEIPNENIKIKIKTIVT